MLLGAMIGTLVYFRHFPSHNDPDADLPVLHYYAWLRAEWRVGGGEWTTLIQTKAPAIIQSEASGE